jgi:capsular polysaccharide biosynthesis protein
MFIQEKHNDLKMIMFILSILAVTFTMVVNIYMLILSQCDYKENPSLIVNETDSEEESSSPEDEY